ncbi:hypothetical protein POM88_038521 [Heracleum sosnowskyi]|uniref:Uncharacterized protein n=1 Tax=Heracleum sosnowskyi TaxID=360622 RepID=A0AAD8H8N4_9APIA|nr:hypothetical protein POM88_038521 [Heracleum sosnowskyi]
MSAGMLEMAEECLRHANDLSETRFNLHSAFCFSSLSCLQCHNLNDNSTAIVPVYKLNSHPPAAEYANHIHRSNVNLVEAFRNMHDSEQNGNEMPEGPDGLKEEGQDDQKQDSHDESVMVDADSTDGAVFVNGNEAEEEWGNNAGNPTA